jgi:hypothetical protein
MGWFPGSNCEHERCCHGLVPTVFFWFFGCSINLCRVYVGSCMNRYARNCLFFGDLLRRLPMLPNTCPRTHLYCMSAVKLKCRNARVFVYIRGPHTCAKNNGSKHFLTGTKGYKITPFRLCIEFDAQLKIQDSLKFPKIPPLCIEFDAQLAHFDPSSSSSDMFSTISPSPPNTPFSSNTSRVVLPQRRQKMRNWKWPIFLFLERARKWWWRLPQIWHWYSASSFCWSAPVHNIWNIIETVAELRWRYLEHVTTASSSWAYWKSCLE